MEKTLIGNDSYNNQSNMFYWMVKNFQKLSTDFNNFVCDGFVKKGNNIVEVKVTMMIKYQHIMGNFVLTMY